MRVLWLQDLDPFTMDGGAQITDRAHITYGLRRGHDIDIAVGVVEPARIRMADLVAVSACTTFPLSVFQDIADAGTPEVWFFHDYATLCKFRLFYAMRPKCKVCYLRDRWVPIMSRARLLIWLSPLHRRTMLYMAPELAQVPYALVPSPVSDKDFYPMGLERRGTLAVNAALSFKGGALFQDWVASHPDEPVTLVGAKPEMRLSSNVTYLGVVPYTGMNDVYNRHERFLHLAERSQPFERTVAEAYLAGCRLTVNGNIGAVSWPFFKKGRVEVGRVLAGSSQKFWRAIERVIV